MGKGEKKGVGETPRGVAIATPIIRMPTASVEKRERERERERERGREKPVGCENGERLLYETGSSLSSQKESYNGSHSWRIKAKRKRTGTGFL